MRNKSVVIKDWILLEGLSQRGTCSVLPKVSLNEDCADFDVDLILGTKGLRNVDIQARLVLFCMKALDSTDLEKADVAVVSATSLGSLDSQMKLIFESKVNVPPYKLTPGNIPNSVINSTAGLVAIWQKIKGPNISISAMELSFYMALSESIRIISLHDINLSYITAVETFDSNFGLLCRKYIKSANSNVLPENVAAAFKLDADVSASKGSGLPVIEYCVNGKAYHATTPNLKAIDEIINLLSQKEINSDAITYINLNYTDAGNSIIISALKKVFKNAEINFIDRTPPSEFSTAGALQLADILEKIEHGGRAIMACVDNDGFFGVALISRHE